MRRREVIAGIGAVAATRPDTLRAQQAPTRRVGLLPITARQAEVFRQTMGALGYREGQSVVFDVRSSADPNRVALRARPWCRLESFLCGKHRPGSRGESDTRANMPQELQPVHQPEQVKDVDGSMRRT
jgi:hypothetical protein